MTGYGGNFDRPLSTPIMGSCRDSGLTSNGSSGEAHLRRRAMKTIKIIVGLAAFYFLFNAAWQVGACELANIELKDDLQDMSTQLGVRIGASDVASDDDLRVMVLRKAEKYNIALAPDQVVVMRDGYGKNANIYLEADYSVAINLPRFTFSMYFNPSSAHKRPTSSMASDNSSQ